MAYFDTCPKCGAHNDPGEKCSCTALLVLDRCEYIDARGVVKSGADQSTKDKKHLAEIYKFNF